MSAARRWRASCIAAPLLAAVSCFADTAFAATTRGAPADEPIVLPDVIVEASRLKLRQRIDAFVDDVTRRGDGESPPLWYARVCPLVAGLSRTQGNAVLERVTRIALDAGIEVAAEGCRPNLYLVFAADPPALLQAWRRRDRSLFAGAPRAQIDTFLASERPVRAWYRTGRIGADGVDRHGSAVVRAFPSGDVANAPDVGRLPNS